MQDLRAEPVAARSKAWICGLPLTGIVGTNTADGMDIYCECCVLSGRGLCDGLITRLDESYRLWRIVVRDLEKCVNEKALFQWGLLGHGGWWEIGVMEYTEKSDTN